MAGDTNNIDSTSSGEMYCPVQKHLLFLLLGITVTTLILLIQITDKYGYLSHIDGSLQKSSRLLSNETIELQPTHSAQSVATDINKSTNQIIQLFNTSQSAHNTAITPYLNISQPVLDTTITDTDSTWVLLLSYQRSGSSFIGGIFDDPEHVFYVYEPLDPLYAAMYGIPEGWTVPSDVFSNRNGSLRNIPEDELMASSWVLERIYSCEMASLPPAMLAHAFWYMFNRVMSHSHGYLKCLNDNGVRSTGSLRTCQMFLRGKCGQRFGSSVANQNECKKYLWGEPTMEDYVPRCIKNRGQVEDDLPQNFKNYYNCLNKIDPILQKCALAEFDAPCKAKKLHAVKTVRANMQVAERLLSHDNTYLVHLYRDPRGAVLSRSKAGWSQGFYSLRSIPREATLYCSQVLSDIQRRVILEQNGYRSRIKELVYDGFVMEPLLSVLDIYHFLNFTAPSQVKNRYIQGQHKPDGKSSESISKKWEKYLKATDIELINVHCSALFDISDFKFN